MDQYTALGNKLVNLYIHILDTNYCKQNNVKITLYKFKQDNTELLEDLQNNSPVSVAIAGLLLSISLILMLTCWSLQQNMVRMVSYIILLRLNKKQES